MSKLLQPEPYRPTIRLNPHIRVDNMKKTPEWFSHFLKLWHEVLNLAINDVCGKVDCYERRTSVNQFSEFDA